MPAGVASVPKDVAWYTAWGRMWDRDSEGRLKMYVVCVKQRTNLLLVEYMLISVDRRIVDDASVSGIEKVKGDLPYFKSDLMAL